jgi:hypothetical protein
VGYQRRHAKFAPSRAIPGVFVALAIACVAVVVPSASAQEDAAKAEPAPKGPPTQKVLGLRIEGFDLSAKDREDLFKVVQQRLKAYPTIELVRPPEAELTDLMIDLGCLDIDVDCLTKVGRKRMADRVFYAQVDASDPGYVLTVRLIDVTKGAAEFDRKSDVAGQADLADAIERQIVLVFGPPPPPKPKDGMLIIETDAGAKIYIDGRVAGAGRVKLKKPPGLYVVRISKPGFEDALFRVDLKAGKKSRRIADLKPIPVPEPPPVSGVNLPKVKPTVPAPGAAVVDEPAAEPAFYETWWFWTAVGAVVVSATTVGVVVGTRPSLAPTGDLQLSVDPSDAWRDAAIHAGSSR